jgi:endonuclease/exonuclease/phosphatase family metal-dependent hydrolase
VRLVSFNLLHGRSLRDGRVDGDRVLAAIGGLDADVLGLQEVDRNQPRSARLDLPAVAAEALSAPYCRFAPALIGTPGGSWVPAPDETAMEPCDERTGPPAAYGVALVSWLPVRSWHLVRFSGAPVRSPILVPGTRRPIWVRDEPRVLLAAVIETPTGVATVATTHLSFVPGWNAAQLRRAVAALRRLPGPRLLLGDLNLPGRLPALVTGWRSLAAVKTYPSDRPSVQLDHVLADGTVPPVRRVQADAMSISDHRALIVELADA